jgi:outer membrane protein
MKAIVLFAVNLIAFQSYLSAQQAFPDTLTIEQSVSIAIANHPSLRVAEAFKRSSSSNVTGAQANYFPSVNVNASDTRTGGLVSVNPSLPSRTVFYSQYSTGVSLQQTIYDFGKTSGRVSAAEDLYNASSYDYDSTREGVIMNVELAYISFVQAQHVVTVDQEAVAQAQLHLKEAQAGYVVGTRPEFDVTKAEVDLANANVNLISSRNQARIVRLQFENAMGFHPATDYSVQDIFQTPPPPFTIPLDTAKFIALQSRAEILAAEATVHADQELVSATSDQSFPTLALTGSYTWNGFDFPLLSEWKAGLTFSLPVFEGFSISSQVEDAQATVDAAQASLDLLKASVLLDVEQNYLSVKDASERIAASQKLVTESEQSLKLAEGRYNSGVGSPIEITDAQVDLSNARITYIQALSDYNSSIIRLRRAMGIIAR